MDPDATYADMLSAQAAGYHQAAREHAQNLLAWLGRGGFPPKGMTRNEARDAATRIANRPRNRNR